MKKIVACMMGFVLAAGCLSGCGENNWVDVSTGAVNYQVPPEWEEKSEEHNYSDLITTQFSMDNYTFILNYFDLTVDKDPVYQNIDDASEMYEKEENFDGYYFDDYEKLNPIKIDKYTAKHFTYSLNFTESGKSVDGEYFGFDVEDGIVIITVTHEKDLDKASTNLVHKVIKSITVEE
ncbi:hypothetical protein [Massilioclostridium coli]|uniref:hypothetical protein n=1 Tax=Massilioclostridium coli TaxID=1870991 RepID=UPI00085BE821|nr:hypothetical protein [Massilioclostridium coli]